MKFTQDGWRMVRDKVGPGKLVGKLIVNQVYAKYQHERLDLAHPHGGGAKYLERPLMARGPELLRRVGTGALEGDGAGAMIEAVEALNSAMSSAAPVLFNNLRRSGRPKVYDNGRLVYDRPPWQPRLSKGQLRALRRGRHRR